MRYLVPGVEWVNDHKTKVDLLCTARVSTDALLLSDDGVPGVEWVNDHKTKVDLLRTARVSADALL